MASVDAITSHIDSTTPHLDESLGKAQTAATDAEKVVAGLKATKDEADALANLLSGVGITGRAGEATAAANRAEELTGSAQSAKSTIDSSVDQLSALKNDLTELRAQVESLRGLLHTATGTGGAPPPSAPAAPRPAGTWVPTPGGTRSFGNPFNAEYEEWVRTSTGGPATGSEYLVEGNGEKAHFDATTNQTRDGRPTEVLIDAKGRYAQFVDSKTGDFHGFFRKQGAEKMMKDARRQVLAADGRPVEWWCAEEEAADAFDLHFDANPKLSGRIEAVHKPMP